MRDDIKIIEIFKQLTKIPRCSKQYDNFIGYMQDIAKKYNYICQVDKNNNILCYKQNGNSKICLQSHYDIVCLEDNTIPTIIEEDGYLKAVDSTLGADNGIGCAYMIALMQEDIDAEFLFTSDEEIGLIGANGIEFDLKSSYMLNLDSEEQGDICIGCAGGVDIIAINSQSSYIENIEQKTLYEVEVSGLDGGHSGVDIDKNIPNAIKLLAKVLYECEAELLDISGGQRINSIPTYAKAIIVSQKEPKTQNPNITIKKLNSTTQHYKKLDDNILKFLYIFANGVRGYDQNLGVVLTSINLAIVKNNIDNIQIELSARSMDNNELETIELETVALLESFNFDIKTYGKYPAWKPIQSNFTQYVLECYNKVITNVTLGAIHAGLECAIMKQKYPNMQICSIGPNIYFPHSKNEKCEIASVNKIYQVIKQILDNKLKI